jgi:hypothetical protein
MEKLLQYDNLFKIELTSKVINFRVNGLLAFQKAKTSVVM